MNAGIFTLLGYAVNKIVVPFVDSLIDTGAITVNTEEIQSVLSESEETLSIVSALVDVFA